MAYCGPRGIPDSFFLGGPNTWTQADRDKALAWADQERRTCRCGTRREQWDPAKGGHRHAFHAELDICPGCEQIERVQAAATSDPSWKGQRGLRVLLTSRAPDPPS